jgi:hypothetical protein
MECSLDIVNLAETDDIRKKQSRARTPRRDGVNAGLRTAGDDMMTLVGG